MSQRICVLTHSPSPYQVELMDRIQGAWNGKLSVIYLFHTDPSRSWSCLKARHSALALDGDQARFVPAVRMACEADLFVINCYNDALAARLIRERTTGGRPWSFWGERPGFRHPWLGRLARRWKLRALHACSAPIWGIGRIAVEGYCKEFGSTRPYENVPYFSDLSRFQDANGLTPKRADSRVFLFSGALTERKGVDLLCHAFLRLAYEFPGVRLKIMGDGPLRARMVEWLKPVEQAVEFLGFRDWAALPEVYQSADVLCVPSRYDGWGLVVPEGLASGLPVIGTDRVGAAIEFLETGRNGWLIRAGNESALYDALREAALLPTDNLAGLSAAARSTVQNHSLQRGAHRFLAAAEAAVANWRSN